MRKPRRKLPTSSEVKALRSSLTPIHSNARLPKENASIIPMSLPNPRTYRMEVGELLWRYKALKVKVTTLQKYIEEKTATASKTSDKPMAKTLSSSKSWYADESGRLIFGPGPRTTS